MLKALVPLIAICLIAAPAQARDPAVDLGPGAFVGAQFKLPLGGTTPGQPRAGFAIAPTRSNVANDGMVRTQLGDGFMLNLVGPKPTLRLAGTRADTALGLNRQGSVSGEQKLGLSTGTAIAIGVGTLLLVGGIALAVRADEINDSDE